MAVTRLEIHSGPVGLQSIYVNAVAGRVERLSEPIMERVTGYSEAISREAEVVMEVCPTFGTPIEFTGKAGGRVPKSRLLRCSTAP